MKRRAVAVLLLVFGSAGAALATDVVLAVHAPGFESSTVTVGPGCGVNYRILAELTDASNQGLAAITFDLEFGGGTLAQGDVPVDLPMVAFAPPNGLSNPDGYGGTPAGGRLLQAGGSQNVVMHGQWGCETDGDCPSPATCNAGVCTDIAGLPLGVVVPDVAYPGSPVAVLTGFLTAPSDPGVYEFLISNAKAGVLELGATGRRYWPVEDAGIASLTGLSVIVQPGASCSPGPGACCVPSGLCSFVLPEECVTDLGGITSGSGSLCEGDIDGDGIDGTCGDACPGDPFKLDPGLCGCGVVDSEADSDGDTVLDCVDQCPGLDDLVDNDNNGIPDCLQQQPAIPTMSEWGLVVFAMLLAGSASMLLRRRRLRVK